MCLKSQVGQVGLKSTADDQSIQWWNEPIDAIPNQATLLRCLVATGRSPERQWLMCHLHFLINHHPAIESRIVELLTSANNSTATATAGV